MKERRITAIIAAAIVTALCMSGCADSIDCTFYETTGNTNPFFVKTQGDCFYIPDYSEHPGIWEYACDKLRRYPRRVYNDVAGGSKKP